MSRNQAIEMLIRSRVEGRAELASLANDMEKLAATARAAGDQQADAYAAIADGLRKAAERSQTLAEMGERLQELADVGAVASEELEALTDEMGKLGRADAAVQKFRALDAQSKAAADNLDRLKTELTQTKTRFDAAGTSANHLRTQLAGQQTAVNSSAEALKTVRGQLSGAAADLQAAGISTKNLAQQQGQLDAAGKALAQRYLDLQAKERAAIAAHAEEKKTLASLQGQLDSVTREREKLGRSVKAQTEAQRAAQTSSDAAKAAAAALAAQIRTAGVDTNNLSAAQQRLRASYAQLAQAAAQLKVVGDARDTLGIKDPKAVEAEVRKLTQAYETLKASGKLTGKELAQAHAAMKRQIDEVNQSAQSATQSFEDLAGAVVGVTAVGAGLTLVADKAIDFEAAMSDVKKVAVGTDAEMEALAKRLKELSGDELPYTASQLSEIAAAGAKIGTATPELSKFAVGVGEVGTAFAMTAEQAGTAIATLQTIFGISLDQAISLTDAINALNNNLGVSEAAVTEVVTRAGGMAVQFGLSAEQTAALSAAFLKLGKSPDVAGTAINALLGKLATASSQGADFQDALASMGLSAEQLAVAIRTDPQRALTDLLTTMGQLDSAARSQVLSKMFGAEYAPAISTLIGAMDTYGKAVGVVADKTSYAGAVHKEFSNRMKTTASQLQLMQNSATNAAINLGTLFLPIIQDAANKLGDAAKAVAWFAEEFPQLAKMATVVVSVGAQIGALKLAFAALSAVAGPAMVALQARIATLSPTLAGVTAMVGKLGRAFGVLSAGLIGYNIGGYLHDNFELARRAGVMLVDIFGELRLGWQLQNEAITAVFTNDTIDAALSRYYKAVADHREAVAGMYRDAERVPGAVQSAADQAAAANQQLAQGVQATREQIQQTEHALTGVEGQAKTTLEALIKLRQDGKATADQLNSAITDAIKSADNAAAFTVLRGELQNLVIGGKLTKETFAELSKEVDAAASVLSKPVDKVGEIVRALAGMAEVAKATTVEAQRQIAANIGGALEKLNDEELPRLAEQARQQFGELSSAARVIAGQALQRLGVDADRALDGISAESKRAIAALKALGAAGTVTGDRLRDSLAAALERADTPKALERLRVVVSDLGKAGRISGDQLRRALEAVDNKAEDVARSLSGLEEDFRALGITSTAVMQSQAAEARAALARVADAYRSGTATALDYYNAAQAALEMTQKAGTATEVAMAQAQAETAAVSVEFSQYAEAAKRAGEAGRKAGDATAGGAKKAKESVEEAGEEAERSAEKQKKAAEKIQISWEQMGITTAAAVKKVRQEWEAADRMMSNLQYEQVVLSQEAATRRAAQGIKDQAAAVADLVLKYEGLNVRLDEQIPTLEEMRWQFDLLDEADLDNLNDALDSARQRVADLRAEAQDAKQSLEEMADAAQDELDREDGNEEAVTRRKYAKEREQVEEQRRRGAGDAEVEAAARKTLELLNQQEEREVAAARAKAAERDGKTKTKAETAKPGPSAPDPTPTKTERIVIEVGGQTQTLDVAEGQGATVRSLIDQLVKAKQVSL